VNRPGSARPFRFGVAVMPTGRSSASTIQQTARAAAEHGYSILLVPDSMFLLSPLPTLAIAASAADIRVGTFVMSVPLRAPAVTAWEALLGCSYITISEPLMEEFAPVVQMLAGK
jgi:alkanesulfonate monooxygenase SsuD/methylene tetrahydromethanopterin reductase-like flavin-dependent oxidoreductase (luciferase family)